MPPSPDTAVTQRQQPVPILLLLVQVAIFCLIAGSPSGWASTIKPGTPEWLLYNRAPSSPKSLSEITFSQANAIFSAQSRCFQKSGTPPRRSSPLAWQLSNGRNFPRLLNNETALSIFRFYISTKPIACVFAVPPQASGADSRAAAHCRRQPTPSDQQRDSALQFQILHLNQAHRLCLCHPSPSVGSGLSGRCTLQAAADSI
jgi:hypothetical protein